MFRVVDRASELIRDLRLEPHPEGGWYRRVWQADSGVEPQDDRGPRPALTAIYYLLTGGAVGRWHRVRSDELWHYYEGAPLELLRVPPDEFRLERLRLGPLGPEQEPLRGVPAGWWQAARSLGDYSLVGCTVGPGFEFADFELLSDRPQIADALREALPEIASFL
jgi:predicted cupin superfamily sugar epimerase